MEELLVLPPQARSREQLLTALYKESFPKVAKYIQRKGGSFEEAKDIFHDALIYYCERDSQGQDPILNKKAYLMGIVKHLWSKHIQKKSRTSTLLDFSEHLADTQHQTEPSVAGLLNFLQQAGEKCMELLQSFYYEKKTLEEIASRFGFSGIRSATVQKYKCLEKVRNSVKEKSLHYEDFLD